MSNALATASRARAHAAARNTCTALVPADAFPTMSPEMKVTYELLQGLQTEPCVHCGNAVPLKAYMGCGAHPACEDCAPDTARWRKSSGCCAVRGCGLPVPAACIAIPALTEARTKAAECLHKMVFALRREEARDPVAEDGSDDDESVDEDADAAVGGKRKRGKMSAEKAAAMKAKRRATMAAKKDAAAAALAAGARAVAELAVAKVEIVELKGHVALLQAALRLAEAPPADAEAATADVDALMDGALDAMLKLATSAEEPDK